MSWYPEDVQTLLDRFFPGAYAWEAVIPEAEFDIRLNEDPGCQEIEGIAIDLEGDGQVDRFLYDRDYLHPVALSAPSLDYYIRPPGCYGNGKANLSCKSRSNDLTPVGFPFAGQLLPNSAGKITSILFANNKATHLPLKQLLAKRPDLDCQILYQPGSGDLLFTAPTCARSTFFPYTPRECDLPPCGGGMWVQNELSIGINEFGALVAVGDDERKMDLYVNPVVEMLGAIPLQTYEDLDTGDLLSSTKHLFFPEHRDFLPDDNFIKVFAANRSLVAVDDDPISSAAHLDMILTPTEEVYEGKPVVIVAKAVPWYFGLFSQQQWEERRALNQITENLQEQGFHVERIPYIDTGERKHFGDGNIAYSYNNCLIERYWEKDKWIKHVYLPWYANYEKYNQEASAVFTKYGYEVVPIRGLETGSDYGGSLYCMVKVTNRDLQTKFQFPNN